MRFKYGWTIAPLLAGLCAVAIFFAPTAQSDEATGDLPSQADVAAAIESGSAEGPVGPTDPSAAEDVPLEDLDRDEALDVLNGVFGVSIEAAAGIYDELDGANLLGPHVAVIGGPEDSAALNSKNGAQAADSTVVEREAAEDLPEAEALRDEGPPQPLPADVAEGAELLDSTLPIEVGAGEPLDLSLVRQDGHLEPAAPLVRAEIPADLDEKIELPEVGIGIEVVMAEAQRTASISDGSVAFYPNVAEDADFAVSATPTGIESFMQLRGTASPESHTYQLTVPAGAELAATDAGGAEVVSGEEVLLSVPAPVALDAAGEPVPVDLEVSGNSLTVRAEPEEDSSYPILVDPLFQTYQWSTNNTSAGICSNSIQPESSNPCNNREEWGYDVFNAQYYGHMQAGSHSFDTKAVPGLAAHAEQQHTAGDHATLLYTVPRFFKDSTSPTSFISSVKFTNIIWETYGSYNSPYMFIGLWDTVDRHWFQSTPHNSGNEQGFNDPAWAPEYTNPQPGYPTPETHVKAAEVSITATENTPSGMSNLFVGGAAVGLGDTDTPETPIQTSIGPWVNNAASPVAFKATDTGLGSYAINATTQEVDSKGKPLYTWRAVHGCIGVGDSACPRTWSSSLTYDPSVLPTGVNYLRLIGEDPVGNKSASGWAEVRVDHIAPTLALTGPITEQDSLGTRRASYTLKATAADGNAEHPQAGIASIEVKLDGKKVVMEGKQAEEWSPKCATQNCPLSAEWILDTSAVAEGKHTIEVITTDAAGNASAPKALTIETRPASPPALSLSGSMTEQATLGTSRPRYVLKAKSSAMAVGSEAPTLGAAASYLGEVGRDLGGSHYYLSSDEPADVATDSRGNAWVINAHNNAAAQLQEFNEKGEWLRVTGGSGNGKLNSPAGVAIDSASNVWVADTGNNRIVEFNEKGEFVLAFGTNVNKTKVEAAGTEAEKNLCTAASGNVCQAATAGSSPGQLKSPMGIALTSGGNVWVADTGNSRLEKFTPSGGLLNNISGEGAEPGKVRNPSAITVAPDGSIWVADFSNNRIEQWNSSLAFVRAVGSVGTEAGQFRNPSGIEADSTGAIWVSDYANGRVQEFDGSNGAYLQQFKDAAGSAGTPAGLAIDPKGSIWVADKLSFRIYHWMLPGFPVYSSSVGSPGSGNSQFTRLAGLASDGNKGHVWALDQELGRLQEFNEKGEWLRSAGSKGSGAGMLSSPTGLASNGLGNVWVADTGNSRIVEFNEKGEFILAFGTNVNKTKVEAGGSEAERNLCTAASGNVCQAATAGSAAGQLKAPKGIALTSGGNVWVADTGNSRIQKFTPTGGFLNNISGEGSEPGKLKEPAAITVAPDGSIWVADTGNNRIQQWNSSLALVRTIGKEGSGGGAFKSPAAIFADASGNIWVGDQGNNRVEEFGEGGGYRGQFGANGSGKFSFSAPMGIAIDNGGSIWVADPGHSKIQRWSQETPRSEIMTNLWVDGVQKTGLRGTCKTSGCTIEPQWTLDSAALEDKSHVARVKTTDGLGRSTESTLNFQITRDTVKPTLEATGELVNAPEGWVEQETYGLNATASDAGFGVTSLAVKIDGQQVALVSQSCLDGGCKQSLSKQISMAAYSGGAHAALIVATDGAGNTTTKSWTINVDPEGHISTSELADTLEAVETTTDANLIGAAAPEAIEGTDAGLGVETGSVGLKASGSNVPLAISSDPSRGITMQIMSAQALNLPCNSLEEKEMTEASPEADCLPSTANYDVLQPIAVVPQSVPSTPGGVTAVEGNAATAANTFPQADTIIRPLFDGALTFHHIRDAAAPEEYSWEVQLLPGQYMQLADPHDVQVFFASDHPAFAIQAQPASDAIGATVPTSLAVKGNVVTETVAHRNNQFVYPVVDGVGWEGGFISTEIPGPKDEQELREERERLEREKLEALEAQAREEIEAQLAVVEDGGWMLFQAYQGPPVLLSNQTDSEHPERERAYRFNTCYFEEGEGIPFGPGDIIRRAEPNGTSQQCHGSYEEHDGVHNLMWAYAVHGLFHYRWSEEVWIEEPQHCTPPWGPNAPIQLNCLGPVVGHHYGHHIDVIDKARWYPGQYARGWKYVCGEIDGVLSTVPPPSDNGERVLHQTMHFYREQRQGTELPCGWDRLHEGVA